MQKILWFSLLALLPGAAAFAQAAAPLTLAANKTATMPIIIHANASAETREVAGLLADYLHKMSGATFQIKTGNGATGIVLGTLDEFPQPPLTKPLEIRNQYDGREAYAIRTETKRLLLIAATELGVSHAAFRLLEELGCRRFFPLPEWEVIPNLPTLRVNLQCDDRPVLLARRVWAGNGSAFTGGDAQFKLWRRFNRMASSFTPSCGHAWPSIYYANKAAFIAHPEYASLVKGKRVTDPNEMQLCVTNPAVQQMGIDYAVNYFTRYPHAEMVSVEPNDGAGHCECDACQKLGSKSNYVFYYANIIARAVAEKCPGKMVGLLAYSEHSDPPSFDLEPNIYVQLTRGYNWGQYSFDELLHLWAKKARHFGIYDYYSIWVADYDKPPLMGGADIRGLQRSIKQFVNAGATSLDAESSTDWGPYGQGYYIANRLMWNANADVEALLKDFYAKAFGPAAAPMRAYYARFDPGNKVPVCEDTLARAYGDVATATKLAAGRPDVLARLDHIKLYLHYVRLRWHFDREHDRAKKKTLAFELMRHMTRIKDTNLLYNYGLLRGWSTSVAVDFGEPTWSWYDPTQPKPYALDKPYTRAEIDTLFQEGVADFSTVELLPLKTFSNNLLPVRFSEAKQAPANYATMTALKYACYLVDTDDTLTVKIMAGLSYRNKPPVNWQVEDARGKVVAKGTAPLDQKWHQVEVTGLAPGLYFFTPSSSSGMYVSLVQARPFTLVMSDDTYTFCGVMAPMYFYVPKGTKTFQYFISTSGPHDLAGPDGKIVQRVEPRNGYVTVTVPEGMDGKPWSLRNICLGRLIFRNLPNLIADSPNALLLPAEVVKSDGLQTPAPLPEDKPAKK